MPDNLKVIAYTFIFFFLMMITVPRQDIRRLSIYGLIFGAIIDIITLSMGKLFGIFEFINFYPFGYWAIPFFSPLSWAVYYVMYFYFLPREKPLIYIYVVSGIVYSILFTQLLYNLNIVVGNPKFFPMSITRVINPIIIFSIWFPFSTWGYLKLSSYIEAIKTDKIKKRERKLQLGELH